MIAKLRVGWMVAGWALGVRTITRSALFHCTTGLTGAPEELGTSWRSLLLDLVLYEPLASTENPAQTSANTITILDIIGFLSFLYTRWRRRSQDKCSSDTLKKLRFLLLPSPLCATHNQGGLVGVTTFRADLFLFALRKCKMEY